MVFQAFSGAEAPPHREFMATAPVKSQPLHNFSLPFLKWGKNQMSNHRCRRVIDSSREASPHDHRSSASEADSDGGSLCRNESEWEIRKCTIGSRRVRNRFSFSSCASAVVTNKSHKSVSPLDADGEGVEEVRGKLLIRFRTGSKEESVAKNKSTAVADGGGEGGQVDESASKPWNLRPRRAVCKVPIDNVGTSKNGELLENLPHILQTENQPKSLRLRGFAEAQNGEKKEKRKLSITLSRDEIEEDIFSITGSKPSRRPRKRARNIQKQLDNVFPGLWLAGITEDSYKVPDAPPKRSPRS